MQTEQLILSSLLYNEDFTRKVIPHIDPEYFSDKSQRVIFEVIRDYFTSYNNLPTKTALLIDCENKSLPQPLYEDVSKTVSSLSNENENTEYLVVTTEKFCKERAIFNALMQSVQIVDGKDKQYAPDAIPSILSNALAVCFDNTVGHDFTDDYMNRYDYYHRKENRIPTGINIFDKVTRGGIPRKTLNVILAPPHGGKSLMMVNFAIGAMNAGHNVLYITMEMAEEEIAKRFDVNLLGVDFDMLESMNRTMFENKFTKLKEKSLGKLKIKEYPTGGAHAGHFKILLEDLKVKQNFVPDVIIVDYLNICASQKYKAGSTANSYTIVKSIGEELRALAIESNTALWTATQTTRSGIGNSDIDMTSTSESIGIPAICDAFFAIIDSDDLKKLNQLLIKQLKNRYEDKNKTEKFVIGIDRAKMKLYDVEDSAQAGISTAADIADDIPLFDKGKFGVKKKIGFDGFVYD